MRQAFRACSVLFLVLGITGCADEESNPPPAAPPGPAPPIVTGVDWIQWGMNPQHQGSLAVVGQNANRVLAEVEYDFNIDAQKAETNGKLLVHYQVPMVVSDQEVLVACKQGRYITCSPPGSGSPAPCGSAAWNQQLWMVRMLAWEGSELLNKWIFQSDWKPPPDAGGLGNWEPVFHAVIAQGFVYVPGFAGTIHKLDRSTGDTIAVLTPPLPSDAATFVAGPLTADAAGNVYYNALRLNLSNPWFTDAVGSWLVRLSPDDSFETVPYSALVAGAPAAGATTCETQFSGAALPWPPSPTAVAPTGPCGSQRPGLNVAPAIAPNGVIYTVSRTHFNSRYGYLVAVNPDLTPRWTSSLRDRLNDGCGSPLMPPTGAPGGCRAGATPGVDPATNNLPAGRVVDQSSASPTVAPDGSILYGAQTRYNGSRGHMMKFSASGAFQAAYDFGWDTTPAIWSHDGTYSIIIKDNHYPAGSYCGNPAFCPVREAGPFDLTQLSPTMQVEWKFTHSNTMSCSRQSDGSVSCLDDHPNGTEWCVNAPAVDANGVVYANAEDGKLYAIAQGGVERESVFLDSALGAAYTPLAIGSAGRIYTQNNGILFVVGN